MTDSEVLQERLRYLAAEVERVDRGLTRLEEWVREDMHDFRVEMLDELKSLRVAYYTVALGILALAGTLMAVKFS